MPAVSVLEAQELIMDTYNAYSKSLRLNKDNPSTPFFYARNGLADLERILANPGLSNELFNGLDAESYNYLLRQCNELADLYALPTKRRLKGAVLLKKVGLENKTVEKLMTQVRKFRDKQLVGCLSDIETGNGFIAFEEMDKLTEGYTKFENGQLKYCLNRKYEKITAEEDLWRASIILAHELQRNPATGHLKGETAEIVQNDVKFIEQLTNEHGKRVYDLNPDFLVMHYVKEMFGDEGVKAFADTAFVREGSYWRITGPFRDFLSTFNPQFRGQSALDFNAVIINSMNALQSIGSMITEVGRSTVEMVSQQTLDTLKNAIDRAVILASDEILNILANSSARVGHRLKETSAGSIKTTIDLVVELDRHGDLNPMIVAGVSWFRKKPTKIGIIEFSIGLRQTFDISLLPGNPISNFINAGGLLGVIRDTMTTMAFAIDAKLSWIVADIGILLRRDLLDFSNRNIRSSINLNTISDDWIAGVHLNINNRRFEWRVNVSDWIQSRR